MHFIIAYLNFVTDVVLSDQKQKNPENVEKLAPSSASPWSVAHKHLDFGRQCLEAQDD